MSQSSKIATCLWFADQAEQAADYYVSTFRACGQQAERGALMHYGKDMPLPEGSVLTAEFTLAGQDYVALNGGPIFTFSPAISLVVKCADQAEVDLFWEKLLDRGTPSQCGWLTDRFGLSWQIVPTGLDDMLRDPDKDRSNRVMQALMKMIKLDIATLKKAYDGK
jgi:predicted 3-demethylubiquinone-9 3-methyltransferase (glyoxalase superfamily)